MPHDVKKILHGFGKTGYVSHQPIAAGTINTNFRVDSETGPWFLRVNEGKAEADVAREADILEYVAARGVQTPLPFATPAGRRYVQFEDAWISLFPWVVGRTLTRAELQVLHAEQAGAALARLHLAGLDYPDQRPGRYEPEEIARRLEAIKAVNDPELRQAVNILEPVLSDLATSRASLLPLGLIHADLFVDNVLFDQPGSLVALLDFEQAAWGRLAYDLAVTVLAFGFGKDDFRPELTRALLSAYKAVRELSQEERTSFGDELRFAACRFAVTRITDVHMRRGQGTPGGKDFNRYLLRLRRVQEYWRRDGSVLSI